MGGISFAAIMSELGGLIIWISKGFKGTYKASRQNSNSTWVGIGFILLIVLFLQFIDRLGISL